MGERGDDAAYFADAPVDVLDELVDAGCEVVEIFVFVGLGDAAGEVAGGSGGDDGGVVRLQVLVLCLEGGFLIGYLVYSIWAMHLRLQECSRALPPR